jgi:23S rRNA pseudouridine955/2504/2580 synthase/23S rRNA pseudouridine1911/1915/1917 synthase
VSDAVKLSSPATGEFWEIPVLFEDDHLLALNKPAGLLVSPDRSDPKRPNLLQLLHRDIERGAPWAKQRRLAYLMNAHRLDFGSSGVMLLVKNKFALVALAAQFGIDQPCRIYTALARGSPPADTFETDAKLAPHPLQMGVIRVDLKDGKRSRTDFTVRERFNNGCLLLECRPFPDRPHQIRVHLKHLRLPLVGDDVYGGRALYLSTIKPGYEPKRNQEERPMMGRPALHAEQVVIDHPTTGEKLTLTAPWAKDLTVSIKYLRRYAGGAVAS